MNEFKNEQTVYITESCINALTLCGWGYNAVALFGAGVTDSQIKVLNNTQVKHYILALDNDPAGIKGSKKLCSNLSKSKFVDVVLFNDQRDVNDLTKEEFESLKIIDRLDYLRGN